MWVDGVYVKAGLEREIERRTGLQGIDAELVGSAQGSEGSEGSRDELS